MALDNLTGQNIQDTYQRVVQTENGAFADGTGSAINIITSNQTGSFVTNFDTGSFVTNSDTGSFVITNSDVLFSNITASANISASGTGSFNHLEIAANATINGVLSIPGLSDVSASVAAALAGGDDLGNHTATQTLNLNSNKIIGVTSISASGEISGSNLSGINTGDQDLSTYIQNSQTASFVTNSQTASFVTNSQTASFLVPSDTASFLVPSDTASFLVPSDTASFLVPSDTASFLIPADTASFALTSNVVSNSSTSSFAILNQNATFDNITALGDIIAENYIVSSSVTYMTQSFSSGSTIFGDTVTDAHQFSGSVFISGSSLQINGSDVLTTSPFTSAGISGSFNGQTGSFVTTSETSSIESNLQSGLTVTLGSNFGGITNGTTFNAGSSIESILRQMLVQYQVPTLNSFTISGLASTLEVGETDTATGGTFATSSDSNGAPFASLALTSAGITFNNLAFSGTSISFDSFTLRKTTAAATTFFLNGTDEEGTSTTTTNDRTDSITWKHPIFFGGSSNDGTGLNDPVLADILSDISGSGTGTGLTDSDFTTDSQTLLNTTSTTNFPNTLILTLPSSVANSNNFTYIVYPATYGTLSSVILNGVQIETGTFSLLGEASHSRHSNEVNYNVYQTAGKNAYSAGDTLTLDDA
jgi:hypothetical protein